MKYPFITKDFDLLMKTANIFSRFEYLKDNHYIVEFLSIDSVPQILDINMIIDIFLEDILDKFYLFDDLFLLRIINPNSYRVNGNKEQLIFIDKETDLANIVDIEFFAITLDTYSEDINNYLVDHKEDLRKILLKIGED